MAKRSTKRKSKDEAFDFFERQLSLFGEDGSVLVNAVSEAPSGSMDALHETDVAALGALDFTAPAVGDPIHGSEATVSVLSGEPIPELEIQESAQEQQYLDLLEGLSTATSAKAARRITEEVLTLKYQDSPYNVDIAEKAALCSRKDVAYEVVRLMADAGCDFSSKQINSGKTALHYTAELDSLDGTVAILDAIENSQEVHRKSVLDAVDSDGVTALATSLFYSSRQSTQAEHISKELLRAGADFLDIEEDGRNAYDALTDLVESLRKTQEEHGNIDDGRILQSFTRVLEDMEARKLAAASLQISSNEEQPQSSAVEVLLQAAHDVANTPLDAPERQERMDALLAAIDAPGLNINAQIAPEVFRQYVDESDATLPQKDTQPGVEANPAYISGIQVVEGAKLGDVLRFTNALVTVDAQSIFREQIKEKLSEEKQQILVSALTQYVQQTTKEDEETIDKKNVNVADPLMRQAVVELIDCIRSGVNARSRNEFKSNITSWMQTLLKTDVVTTDSVFGKLHEVTQARAQDDSGRTAKRIIKDIKLESLRNLVKAGDSLMVQMRSNQEEMLHTSHVLVSRLRWLPGIEKRDVYQTLGHVSGNVQQTKADRHVLDGLLNRDTQVLFDRISEFLDGLSDDLTKKTFQRAKLPFVEGLTQPNTPALMLSLSPNSDMYSTTRQIYETLAAGSKQEERSAVIVALADAAEVRQNREEEIARRAAPRMVIEAVLTMLKNADEQEKQAVSEHLIRAGSSLTEQRSSEVMPLADIDIDNQLFSSFVKAQITQNAANTYLAMAIAGAAKDGKGIEQTFQDANTLATNENDKALRDKILQAGAEIAKCTPDLTQGQRIALTYAACQALSTKADLLTQPNNLDLFGSESTTQAQDTRFVLQRGSQRRFDTCLSGQAMELLKDIRQMTAILPLDESLMACARCAHDISSVTNIQNVPQKEPFLSVGPTAAKVKLEQQGNSPINFSVHAQTLMDIRMAGEYLDLAVKGSLVPDTDERPLLEAALHLQEERQQKLAATSEATNKSEASHPPHYRATVVNSPLSTPDDEWVRLVPTAMTHNSLYLAVKDFAPDVARVDNNAPFWDVPRKVLEPVQDRFSELLQIAVQRGLNPSSIELADGARFDGKVAVPCNRFMEADGSVSRALQEAGADYDEAGLHVDIFAHVYIDAEAVDTFKAALTGNLVKRFEAFLPPDVAAENATAQQWAACISKDCRKRSLGLNSELRGTLEAIADAQAFGYSDSLTEVQQGCTEEIEKMFASAAATTREARLEEQHAKRLLREQGREPVDSSEIPLTGHTDADLRLVANETAAQKQDLEEAARQEHAQDRPHEAFNL
ncbi:MAG: hypothetical protein IKZ87_05765 [Actinomycetaceae bacterium]|nr:hypothetical protein [Actinomycetaceae bacterium]